ncbi:MULTISPECIES: hypothetical protein [Halobacterium]|uniref:DUF6414 family protein n=1 Tax=Halobacterium TaxID=2239 RepID=UPI001965F9F5|nr:MULTISPECIES: hypothetical protein [Halobacterium]MDL0122835.1 hypothetical protein [Halobacterium salinarum]MDL0128063.1 hypothetical protein [Halobacterium salinarum]MDL0132640.1 hypothetical protein [Halobacterium salinarum]MDL0137642.1 hypothetical protein [Halobacterium salinarum]MDL0140896.1 hypothetical protein [Halobacterium salinarum]
MPGRLREFVYLDDISVNSHLASLGVGRPEEIVDVSEESNERTGKGDIKIASGSQTTGSVDSTETQMSATAPYRFQQLIKTLDEEDIAIEDSPAPKKVGRSDIVRITGVFNPMSLYKTEIAVKALLNLIDEDTAKSVTEADLPDSEEESSQLQDEVDIPGSHDNNDETSDEEAIGAMFHIGEIFEQLAEELIGDSVPLRVDYDVEDEEHSAVVMLDRKKFDVSHRDAFFEPKEYVLFGRVEERIPRNDEWDPIRASNIMGRYFEDEDSEGWREDWKEGADGLGISLEKDDLVIEGRSLVVNPIAVYW